MKVYSALLAIGMMGCGTDIYREVNIGKAGDKGNQGANGQDGTDGADGTNGVGCTVTTVSAGGAAPNGGALVTCGPSSTLLLNGAPGANGSAAPTSPYQITAIIDPCGDKPGIVDEVLLKFANGTVLASLSANNSGDYTRLSVVNPGTWITTDQSGCIFTIDSTGAISNEHY